MALRLLLLSFVALLALGGCGRIGFELKAVSVDEDTKGPGEAGGPEPVAEAGSDAGIEASVEAGADAAPADAAPDAPAGDGGEAGDGCTRVSDSDRTCDGVDDDCDGFVDEDFVTESTSCGVGACAATGTRRCVDGVETDSCEPATPTDDVDGSCNGVDDDCDGFIDEDFVAESTSCGVGACGTTGRTSCLGGEVQDDCAPGVAAADDATCDGIDDDCDGSTDEDYLVTSTSCGAGGCNGTGQLTCVAGDEVDSCIPGMPASSDPTCDGVDDDCDGQVDEDYVVTATSCGVGGCAASGTRSCVDGSPVDSCTPGVPAPDDNSGTLNVDDDCDGLVDEDVVCNAPDLVITGMAADIAIPPECTTVTARLWGAGGGSGEEIGGASSGDGGGGGYAESTFVVASGSALDVYVGSGGPSGCVSPGANHGLSQYAGGGGGDTNLALWGTAGQAGGGAVAGGPGGEPSSGKPGGSGRYGGGGGGAGNPLLGFVGNGGGGGAATVLRVNGVETVLAGGGGGGGGAASNLLILGSPGNHGGPGGGGAGAEDEPQGGGGGGGVCLGEVTHQASGRAPHGSDSLPAGTAEGATGSCNAGGDGYAILSFSR